MHWTVAVINFDCSIIVCVCVYMRECVKERGRETLLYIPKRRWRSLDLVSRLPPGTAHIKSQ